MRDGTAKPVSRDGIFRRQRGQEKKPHFPCSVDKEQDRQPYPVDPYSAMSVLSTCPLHTNSGCGKERRVLGPW